MKCLIAKLLLLLAIGLNWGCDRPSSQIQSQIGYRIQPDERVSDATVPFSSLVADYHIVPLESTPDNLISYIYKVDVYGNRIFILDKKSQDKILVFDDAGKYLYGIGRQGRAINEHVAMGGFTIDQDRKQVLILDDVTQKVNCYTLEGEFQQSIPLAFIARDIAALKGGRIAFTGGGQHKERLHITDTTCRLIQSYIPSNDKNWVMLLNSFTRSGDSLIYRNYLNDTLYTITHRGDVTASRFVDFGSAALTWEKFISYNDYQRENIEDSFSEYDCNLKYYAETDGFIWFVFSRRGEPRCVVFDKTTHHTCSYPITLPNDLTFDRATPLIVGATSEYFIGQSNMYSIMSILEEPERLSLSVDSAVRTRYEQIRKIAARSSENSNPILTFIRFKTL